MKWDETSEDFPDLLNLFIKRSGLTLPRLAQRAEINTSTLKSWHDGYVKSPRHWQEIVKVAKALGLPQHETDLLLAAANHHSVSQLTSAATTTEEEKNLLRNLKSSQESVLDPTPLQKRSPFQVNRLLTTYIKREKISKQAREILIREGAICVMYGMGGTGKSSLATQLAYELKDSFPDGVLWADLEQAVIDRELNVSVMKSILALFAEAYGRDVKEIPDLEGRSTLIREILANKKVLLILDNAHGTEDVQPLLPPTGACAVLITTRNRKLLVNEATTLSIGPFSPAEGLGLFRQIVGTERVDQEIPVVQKIINLLGGLPLAICVIASALAESRMLTFQEQYELLVDERSLLEHLQDWEDASKSVRASFELSYKQLPKELQSLFACLAVFPGPDFSAEAVAAIAEMSLVFVKKQLGRLLTLSLLEEHLTDSEVPLASRYRLHPLLRTYAQEKLSNASTALELLNQRLAHYFVPWAEQHPNDYHLLEQDWSNMRASLSWLQQHQGWDSLHRAVVALTTINLGIVGFWDIRGHWRDALQFLTLLLDSPLTIYDSFVEAELLLKRGALAYRLSEYELAVSSLHQSLLLLEKLPQAEPVSLNIAYACEFLAELALLKAEPTPALQWVERGQRSLETVLNERARAEMGYLFIRSSRIRAQDDLKSAIEDVKEGLRLLPQSPSAARVSGLMNWGNLYYQQGETEHAIAGWQEAAKVAEALGDLRGLAKSWQNIGLGEIERGQYKIGHEYQQKALLAFRHIGDVEGEATLLSNLADDYLLIGSVYQQLHGLWAMNAPQPNDLEQKIGEAFQKAETAIQQALDLAERKLPRTKVYALVNMARLRLFQKLLPLAQEALTEAESYELQEQMAELRLTQAGLAVAQENWPAALSYIVLTVEQPALLDDKLWGVAHRLHGIVLSQTGSAEEADAMFQQSLNLLEVAHQVEYAHTLSAYARYLGTDSGREQVAIKIYREFLSQVGWD